MDLLSPPSVRTVRDVYLEHAGTLYRIAVR